MPRACYPPYDFVCSYQDNCPHLDGMSTTWVLEEYRRGEETYNEHLRIIDVVDEQLRTAPNRIRKLERELAEARAKYQALHQKQFKPNRKDADSRAQKADGKPDDPAGMFSAI